MCKALNDTEMVERVMGIKDIFHKIKIGFVRIGENSIPNISFAKRYGNNGEKNFIGELKKYLSDSKVKHNILINTEDANAEIDCLVLYKNKLFAIEVKQWKGRLVETDHGVIQEKTDRWTGEIHSKYRKSPFNQLNRAIFLLKKQLSGNVWINSIVFFADNEFEGITTSSKNIWFDDMKELSEYIKSDGEASNGRDSIKFFDNCVSADLLYSVRWDKSLHCVIKESSLLFKTSKGLITKKDIGYIQIEHHWSYDKLSIYLLDGSNCFVEIENGKISVNENGNIKEYAFSKLDYLEIGQ